MRLPLSQKPQHVINREKHAVNMQRIRDGLQPLDRKHGRRGISTPRPFICRRVINAREVFDSNIRTANAKRTFCGRFATRAEAVAAAEHFLATGTRPVRARQPRKPSERRPAAPKPPKPVPAVTVRRDEANRWAAVYRERRDAIEARAA